ncbi:glycine oxidase ThiO [Metapseudomonas otitidis]|uniref:glycine oxidase ThiO n=1 Tax=Metapseudomonas otitidis TaxID=319939 RepID=UPI001F388865|nr:glycine oxidase ThiO [Pseudomonas otitidis]
MHIGIVGGGVIGLLSAYFLAKEGVKVSIFEKGNIGQESSWAGGGIVSPLFPWRYPDAITNLSNWSKEFYNSLSTHLRDTTTIDPEVYQCGIYWLELDDIQSAINWAETQSLKTSLIHSGELRARLPALSSHYSNALFSPLISNIRNPKLSQSLKAYLSNKGVSLFECNAIKDIATQGEHWVLRTDERSVQLDKILITAGAWSGELLATLGLSLPVEPVKGQMILYKCEPDFLPSMVLAKGRYAIPRRDGHILVGSTLEHEGFDKTPTDVARESLQASAEELIPALAKQPIVGHWAGLRPGSPDGIPFIGPVPGFEGLWLNCGHYRNGLVLAPASCRLLADLMLGREPIVDPTPYAPSARL